jgi:glycosyltransferase involved in cell wall biosynthesis
MTRVAYLLLWFPEPSQTFVLDEVNTLTRLGLEVQVYSLYGPRPATRIAGLGPVAAPVTHLGIASLKVLLQDLVNLRRQAGAPATAFLRQVLRRRWRSLETAGEAFWASLAGVHLSRRLPAAGIDHIHAPWADGPATAAWVASRLSGIPFSFAAHAQDIYPPDGALHEKLATATFVRVISQANADYLSWLEPGAAGKLAVIPIGAPLDKKAAAPRPAVPPYRLLALGRLVPKKGFGVLLQACRLLATQGVDFHLTLAGSGSQYRQLASLIRQYGLSGRVTLPGFVPHRQVPEFMSQTHLFVMPSVITARGDRDGIPTVILEALQHGVPVVASAVSGIPEVIRDGDTGWLVEPGNPVALAQAVTAALTDPEEARRRAAQGRALVSRKFNSITNYGKLKVLFERAINPGSAQER